jgi:hypothetical protein
MSLTDVWDLLVFLSVVMVALMGLVWVSRKIP